MPTVGWIREDALEAFYEGTECTPDPGPPVRSSLRCPFCNTLFSGQQDLHDHVHNVHRVERPVVLIRGMEPTGRTVVRVPLVQSAIVVANATAVMIGIDGTNPQRYLPDDVPEALANTKQGEIKLVLVNESQVNTEPVSTHYAISFRIADPQALLNVEAAFYQMLASPSISRDAISRFLADQRTEGPCRDYASALGGYCLGVLIKERPSSERLTTPLSRYRELYGSALLTLSTFDRPLARLICGVIRFAMNDLVEAESSTGYWELDLARMLLSDPGRTTMPSTDVTAKRRPICPIDHGTARVLDLAVRLSTQSRWSSILDDECRKIASSEVLDAADREKAIAIWAAAAWRTGSIGSAVEPLTQIAAVYPFKRWAEPYLESCTSDRQ